LWQAIAAMQAATMLGATLLYFVADRAGRGLVYRYGRLIRLNPARLARAEHWIKQHGFIAVFLGRLVPGLRIVTAVARGVFEVPFRVFFPAMSLGALIYIVSYTAIGYVVGPGVVRLLERLHIPLSALGSSLLLAVLLFWVLRGRLALRKRPAVRPLEVERHERARAGLAAGALATLCSTLLINVLFHLVGQLAPLLPTGLLGASAGRCQAALARDVEPLMLVPRVFVVLGTLWGAIYGRWAEPRLPRPDVLKGLLFAALPLVVTLLVVMPLLGSGPRGSGLAALLAACGEVIRHAAYGAILSLAYPVLLVRRRPATAPNAPGESAEPASVRSG
ncbi:MAG: DedA family protein, partial [Chloroflexi bacterium]|nr:DedA family protein [Chloroflexota bacterium]